MTEPASPRRPRPVLRALGAIVGFFLLGFLLSALLLIPFAPALTQGATPAELAAHPPAVFVLGQGLILLLAFAAATWVVGVKALGLDATELRWRTPLAWARGLGAGLVLGSLPAAVAMTTGVFAAGATWSHDGGSFGQWVSQVGLTVLFLAPAALSEELMFRGLPMVVASRVVGRGAAAVLLSVLFAFAHIKNPDVTPAGIGNIVLAGIFLSLAFFSRGGMWTAFGAHLGWNVTLAALAAPVSGTPFDMPYIDYHMGSPAWLTGGAFGPEGGLIGTAVLAIATVVVARWNRKEPT
ncbi:MAG TPA: CPBP family intramembrane glutamic endopeptidase [Gemmatimonadales bacterium]|nr:CPBP family intramembrane glutamic endopeptidase [Gemmatimonadales bacterium]